MVTLNYIDRIDVEFTALPYSESYLSRWTGTVTVTNNSKTTPASGEVLLSSQQLLNGIDKKIIFNYIGAGQSQSYSFNLPEVGRGMEYSDVNIAVSLENGYVRETKADFGTTMAAYAKRKPVIDGVLSDGEWETRLPVMLDKNSVFELTSEPIRVRMIWRRMCTWNGTKKISILRQMLQMMFFCRNMTEI